MASVSLSLSRSSFFGMYVFLCVHGVGFVVVDNTNYREYKSLYIECTIINYDSLRSKKKGL